MKKIKTGLLAFVGVMILMTGIWAAPLKNVQAATPKYKTAYSRIIKNIRLLESYQDVSYLKMYFGSQYGWDRYFYYDLDKNGTPELFIYSKSMGLTQIFTYKKKVISLGCYDIDRINTAKKEIIVHGHWHGAGGSGANEWSIYSLSKNKKKLQMNYYIDVLGGRVSVYNSKWSLISTAKSKYNSIKSAHIKSAKKLGKFKMKKLP